MSPLTTSFQYHMRSSVDAIRQEKKMKDTLTGKEHIKLSLFTDDMVIYVEDPKELTKNLKLVSDDNKIAGTRLI